MPDYSRSRLAIAGVASLALVAAIAPAAASAANTPPPAGGFVYTSTNSPTANKVLAYKRNASTGALTPIGSFPTGGTGTGDRPSGPLGSPNGGSLGPPDTDQSLIVSPDHHFLFTVNERSDSIAVFSIHPDGTLSQAPGSPFASGGNMPTSLGLTGNKLYVVNKDNDPKEDPTAQRPNYTGFTVAGNGRLTPIPSKVAAPEGSSPTQALISPDGKHLFSSDFFAHQLRSLTIPANGNLFEGPNSPLATRDYPRPPASGFPAGNIVVGLQVHPDKRIVYVGQAANGLVGGEHQIGVYTYNDAGKLTFVRSVKESGVASCWFIVSRNGRWLYATNTFDSSVSVLDLNNPYKPVEVSHTVLSDASAPNQFTLSPDQKYLYVTSSNEFTENPGQHQGFNEIHVLRINSNGSLTEMPNKNVQVGAYGPLGAASIP